MHRYWWVLLVGGQLSQQCLLYQHTGRVQLLLSAGLPGRWSNLYRWVQHGSLWLISIISLLLETLFLCTECYNSYKSYNDNMLFPLLIIIILWCLHLLNMNISQILMSVLSEMTAAHNLPHVPILRVTTPAPVWMGLLEMDKIVRVSERAIFSLIFRLISYFGVISCDHKLWTGRISQFA